MTFKTSYQKNISNIRVKNHLMALVTSFDYEENPRFSDTKYGYGANLHMGPIPGERKIKDALCYPHLMLADHNEGPVFQLKKPIRSYTEADLSNFSHWASDKAEEKLEEYKTFKQRSAKWEERCEDKVRLVQNIIRKSKRDTNRHHKYQENSLDEPFYDEPYFEKSYADPEFKTTYFEESYKKPQFKTTYVEDTVYEEPAFNYYRHWAIDKPIEKLEPGKPFRHLIKYPDNKPEDWKEKVKTVQKILKKSKKDSNKRHKYKDNEIEEKYFQEFAETEPENWVSDKTVAIYEPGTTYKQEKFVDKSENWEDKVKSIQKIFEKSKKDSKKQNKYQKHYLEEPYCEEMPSNYTVYQEPWNPELDKQAEWSLKRIKKSIRGKSSDAIKNILLKDLETSRINEENLLKDYHFDDVQQVSGTSRIRKVHYELMDDRMSKQLDDSFMQPLDSLRGQLKGFCKKESRYLESKR